MSEWKLLADKRPELWTNALCWRADWEKPDWLMWKENDRITKAIARGEDVGSMVPVYFGDLNEYDDYDCAKPENFPTHWMIPSVPSADEIDRLSTLEAAVRKLVDLVNVYLPEDTEMTASEFISEVIGTVDNATIVEALKGKKNADGN